MRSWINKLSNVFVKPILRSPLHFLMSSTFMLVTFTGRKSGTVYTTPVQYKRQGQVISFISTRSRLWWRNLRGAEVTLRVRGKTRRGQCEAIEDAQVIAEALSRFYRISPKQAAARAPELVLLRVHLAAQPESAAAALP